MPRLAGWAEQAERPVTSVGEENLLGCAGDILRVVPSAGQIGESILIHEFSHSILDVAIEYLDPAFVNRVENAYDYSKLVGRWANLYADENYREYWAEGVQSWFDANREMNPQDLVHNYVNTRGLRHVRPGTRSVDRRDLRRRGLAASVSGHDQSGLHAGLYLCSGDSDDSVGQVIGPANDYPIRVISCSANSSIAPSVSAFICHKCGAAMCFCHSSPIPILKKHEVRGPFVVLMQIVLHAARL